jgi:hypothetical protein
MNEEIFKGAIDGITADKSLVEKTYREMIKSSNKGMPGIKVTLPALSVCLIFIIGIVMFNNYKVSNYKNSDKSIFLNFPQIAKYYSSNVFDNLKRSSNVIGPDFMIPFSKFLDQTDYIIRCTIEDVGDYFRKKIPTPFGTRIYIVKIDNILYGNMDEKTDNIIPIAEKFFAEAECHTQAYSRRPKKTWTLKTGKQYILYLTKQDETDCYGLAGDGFGVFSTDYIEDAVKSTNIDDIRKLIQKDVRFERYDGKVNRVAKIDENLYYKLYALYTNEKFLK